MGRLYVISGPIGSGKTSVVRELLQSNLGHLAVPLGATTRPMRPGEVQGTHYLFVSREEFSQLAADGRLMLQTAVCGHLYGTLTDTITGPLAAGADVLLIVDVPGAIEAMDTIPNTIGIFLRADLATLRGRLTDRSPQEIDQRPRLAHWELQQANNYHAILDANESLERVAARIRQLIWAERNLEREKNVTPV